MRRFGTGATLALALAAAPAAADEVLDQLDAARELYLEGELSQAIGELEFAIQAIRSRTGELYAQTFPAPPTGWSAGEVDVASGLPGMGGQMLSRRYDGPNGAWIEAELMVDNPMMQAFGALLQNPALLAIQPNAERVRVHGTHAILQWPGDGSGEVMLILGGRLLLRLDGYGLDAKNDLLGMLAAWDVATLRQVAGP